mmetsp:Transcript_23737/g.74662  ORF Transcript_23737/g.74662 Transcript_23737/m.74662 type:complete len:201 (-) Transcript_23737:208-810(-)
MGCGNRESHYPELWQKRATDMSELLRDQLLDSSGRPVDLLCVQELWCNDDYIDLVRSNLGERYAYDLEVARRTGGKEDGLAVFLRGGRFKVRARLRAPLGRGCQGQRVAQLLLLDDLDALAATAGFAAPRAPPSVLVVNTHLTFPHHAPEKALQLRQARRLTQLIEEFMAEHLWASPQAAASAFGGVRAEPPNPKPNPKP